MRYLHKSPVKDPSAFQIVLWLDGVLSDCSSLDYSTICGFSSISSFTQASSFITDLLYTHVDIKTRNGRLRSPLTFDFHNSKTGHILSLYCHSLPGPAQSTFTFSVVLVHKFIKPSQRFIKFQTLVTISQQEQSTSQAMLLRLYSNPSLSHLPNSVRKNISLDTFFICFKFLNESIFTVIVLLCYNAFFSTLLF